ncbi:MAG: hypothetical protein GXP03_07175 [Alphaproteobacteria bacterium]|nr:hypothetical protein [Alphaproteobacteria bacterium]
MRFRAFHIFKSIRVLTHQILIVGFLAALMVSIPTKRADAQLEALICGMDPLSDDCIARELLSMADAMPEGRDRDIAVVYSYSGWLLSTRSQSEGFRYPRASAFRGRVKSKQLGWIITALDWIVFREDAERGIKAYTGVKHPIPRMIGYPLYIEALVVSGETEKARAILLEFSTEIADLKSPPTRIASYGELAWLAAKLGETELAQSSIDALMNIAMQHPSKPFQTVIAVDIAAAEFQMSEGEKGVERIAAGYEALQGIEKLPTRIRAVSLARIARAYGRVGLEQTGRPIAQEAINLFDELEPKYRARVMSILVFSRFAF